MMSMRSLKRSMLNYAFHMEDMPSKFEITKIIKIL